MAVKVRQNQREAIYFVTFSGTPPACYKWKPLFEKVQLYDNLYKWFKVLNEKNIKIIGYVFMRSAAQPNHVHILIYLPKDAQELYTIIGNGKRFLAYEIIKRLEAKDEYELLKELEEIVRAKEVKKGKLHQLFKESYDAKECFNLKFIQQKLDRAAFRYIHKNPVSGKWNLAKDYLHYPYSSARFYDLNEIDERVELTHYQDAGR